MGRCHPMDSDNSAVHIARKEQTMKCVDCELHDYIVGTHFCNYKGKSGRRRPRRISEEDAHKDVPCECVGEREGADDERFRQ